MYICGLSARCMQDDSTGRNALILAAAGGHEAVVHLLLEAGVPWNAVDRQGNCAGDLAAAGGHEDMYEGVVAAGAHLPASACSFAGFWSV